jgi:hypothetical protein
MSIVEDQVQKTYDKIAESFGMFPNEIMIRAPGGKFTEQPIPGFETAYYYGWTIDSGDFDGDLSAADITGLLGELNNNPVEPILLFHDIHDSTINAFVNGTLVDRIRQLGYTEFKSLPGNGIRNRRGYPVIW